MGLFSNKKDKEISRLKKINKSKDGKIKKLEKKCAEQERGLKKIMSDGLRHKSALAGKYMRDRRDYLNGK